jgi:hypothetical protein
MSGPPVRDGIDRYVYYLVLPDRDADALLLERVGDGWALPSFESRERRFWQDVDHVNAAASDLLNLDARTLRCMTADYVPEQEQVLRYYALERPPADWSPPPGYAWVRRTEVADLPLATPGLQRVTEDWFRWQGAPPAIRVPWYRPGWFDDAERWIRQQTERLGLRLEHPPQQLRSWQRSAIIRAGTSAGDLYFKAVPPVFAAEPILTLALAESRPEHLPAIVATEPQRHWLLMRDVGSATLDSIDEIERWEAALRDFARLQIASSREVPRLLAEGVPDRRLGWLARRIEALFADHAAMLPDRPAGLSPAQITRLQSLIPEVRRLCHMLATYPLPATVEHGDFWPGQIVVNGERSIFIDWSDASVAHPFFSMLFFLVESEDYFPKQRDTRMRLRDAYLEPWTAYASTGTLIEAFELAQPLAALHHALVYHQAVLPGFEIKWEMELMVPFYLKMLLRMAGD